MRNGHLTSIKQSVLRQLHHFQIGLIAKVITLRLNKIKIDNPNKTNSLALMTFIITYVTPPFFPIYFLVAIRISLALRIVKF